MNKLNGCLIFVLAINCVPFCFTMEIGIDAIASVANLVISKISEAANVESKQMSSLEAFQAGSTVYTPGEIRDLPTALLSLVNLLQTIKLALVDILGVIQKEYYGQDISGPTINIPNGMVQPYLPLIPELESVFSNIISCFQNIGGVVQYGIVPLLTQTLQANGNMIVPVNAINAIKSNIVNMFTELQTLAINLQDAATQSQNNRPASASFKANTVIGLLNSICTDIANDLNNIVQNVGNINILIPSQQVTSTQDEINATIVLKNLNQLFAEVDSVLKTVHGNLAIVKAAINLIKSPIGGALFNLF